MKRPGELQRYAGLRSSAQSTRSGDTGQGESGAQRSSQAAERTGSGPASQARGLVRHKPMRQQSAKRAKVAPKRRAFVQRVLEARPWCELRLPGCGGRSVDVHEPLTRARGGSILDEENALAACRNCHTEAHTGDQELMHQLGFLRHSWDNSNRRAAGAGTPTAHAGHLSRRRSA